MDAAYRMKIKVGPHEFEAEGSPDVVQEQFRMFKEMVTNAPNVQEPLAQKVLPSATSSSTIKIEPRTENVENDLHKIMDYDADQRVVSLTVRPKSADDAVLLVLLGQRILLEKEAVTGGSIMEGITATGGLQVTRVDRLLEKLGREGDVIVLGEHRSKTYRLTNAGMNRARQIATDLLSMVP